MLEGIVLIAWMVYCIINLVKIFKKAKEEGDTPTAHRYARKRFGYILLATLLCVVLTVIIYLFT